MSDWDICNDGGGHQWRSDPGSEDAPLTSRSDDSPRPAYDPAWTLDEVPAEHFGLHVWERSG